MSNHCQVNVSRETSPYLRASEICGSEGLLRVSRSTFYALVAAKKLPPPHKVGRCSLWRRDELLEAFGRIAQ